jgi:S-DNA-T family DNA segregation ATPase FtsK/SpoIIIE
VPAGWLAAGRGGCEAFVRSEHGARDRGAACKLISTDPATGAGVAFIRLEADPDPVRVRAGWVTDTDIRDMAAECLDDMQPLAIAGVPG